MRDELGFDAAFSHHDDVAAGAARGGARRHRRLLRQRRRPAAGGGHRPPQRRTAGSRSAARSRSTTPTEPAPGPRNLGLLVGKRARLRGFIILDHADREPDFRAEVEALIADGRLKLAETVVDGGIEAAPAAFTAMLRRASTSARSSWPSESDQTRPVCGLGALSFGRVSRGRYGPIR